MSVSIFIKTWRDDLRWLTYSLRFLEKNWVPEPRTDIVVMLDNDCRGLFDFSGYNLRLSRIFHEPWPDGYSHAMYTKACADLYCQGELVILMDSDCMLLERADASYFLDEGRPIIPWISYEQHLAMYPHSPWKRVTEKVMMTATDRHYMPQMPIAYWSKTMHDMRAHIVQIHDATTFREVVYSDVPFLPRNFGEHPISFVDYDCLGFYAKHYEPERYTFRHAGDMGPNPFKQFHSWSEFTEKTTKALDGYLHEGAAV